MVRAFLSYWLYPNNGTALYTNPKILTILIFCGALVILSFTISFWRRRMKNPMTVKLSRSWASAAFWFAIVGVLLTVSRAEGVLFLSMRILPLLWALSMVLYIVLQIFQFRTRHYTVVRTKHSHDARDKYLPGKKR